MSNCSVCLLSLLYIHAHVYLRAEATTSNQFSWVDFFVISWLQYLLVQGNMMIASMKYQVEVQRLENHLGNHFAFPGPSTYTTTIVRLHILHQHIYKVVALLIQSNLLKTFCFFHPTAIYRWLSENKFSSCSVSSKQVDHSRNVHYIYLMQSSHGFVMLL